MTLLLLLSAMLSALTGIGGTSRAIESTAVTAVAVAATTAETDEPASPPLQVAMGSHGTPQMFCDRAIVLPAPVPTYRDRPLE